MYLVETDVFSSVLTLFSRKILAWSILGLYEIDFVIFDPKSKRIFPRTVKEKDICVFIHKIQYCVIWRKNRKTSLLNGVEEIDRKFKYVKIKVNENNSKQRNRYRFPKHETVDQLENLFVFSSET